MNQNVLVETNLFEQVRDLLPRARVAARVTNVMNFVAATWDDIHRATMPRNGNCSVAIVSSGHEPGLHSINLNPQQIEEMQAVVRELRRLMGEQKSIPPRQENLPSSSLQP
jgi:hypothetical protein